MPVSGACKNADFIYTRDGKIECGANGEAIILKNNPEAADPTFDELVAFINIDNTDKKPYIREGENAYVCADFAEEVHNKAEAVGIRAGWVAIRFEGSEEGHAINAFETTDKGLVYIDCTNGRTFSDDGIEAKSWDTVAYLEVGKRYGVLHIDRVTSMPYEYYILEYDFYADSEKKWLEYEKTLDAYNEEVDRYNQEISGKVYTIGSPEAKRISAWENDLLQQEQTLELMESDVGEHWYESEFSSYTVEDVFIHW